MATKMELIEQARQAFGLKPEEIMAAAVRGDDVTIVTIAAHKARWRPGAKVAPLNKSQAGRPMTREEIAVYKRKRLEIDADALRRELARKR